MLIVWTYHLFFIGSSVEGNWAVCTFRWIGCIVWVLGTLASSWAVRPEAEITVGNPTLLFRSLQSKDGGARETEREGLSRKKTGSRGRWLVTRPTVTEEHTCREGDTRTERDRKNRGRKEV